MNLTFIHQNPGLRLFALILFSLLAVTQSPAASDWASDWKKLGSVRADTSRERDEIRCASKGFIRHIVFEVRGGSIHFEDVKVHLGDNTVFDAPLRSVVKDGSRSRVIDLPGEARIIKKIEFRYRSLGGKKGEVVVWGKKD